MQNTGAEMGKRDQSTRNGYKTQYNKDNYDYIRATIPRGKRETLRDYAAARGMSISQVIVDALETVTGLDLTTRD